jgi:hypothetical protein
MFALGAGDSWPVQPGSSSLTAAGPDIYVPGPVPVRTVYLRKVGFQEIRNELIQDYQIDVLALQGLPSVVHS